MFWDKSYTPSQNLEALLEKENATVEEFLDDDDILLECRSQKKAIVNYFTRPDVIKRLVELITTEPPEDLPMAQRYRHANMACEILTFGLPSLDEKLLNDEETLRTLYSYLANEPPLNPLLSSFFSKTFSMLFTKKAEQDWFLYQQMCLTLLEYIKSQNNFLDLICKHFSTPVIPDLIMQMMRDVEGGQMKRNLYEWLTEDRLVERLIAIIGNPQETDKHVNVAEFLCDLIQQGRSMRIVEQDTESFEPTFDGSNPILKRIELESNIEALLNVILEPNALESAIVSGISVVLMLLKPVVFTEDSNSDRMKFIKKREQEIREQILSTVIRVIAPRLKDFIELLRNPPNKPELVTTAAKLTQPFGTTRLHICRIFTVLLQTKHEEILKAVCETDFFETLLILFKQYCWNNFLHSEVEKCLQLVFYTQLSNNNNNNTTHGSSTNDVTFNKFDNNITSTYTIDDMVFKASNDNLKKDDNINTEATNDDEKSDKDKDKDVVGNVGKSVEKEDIEMKTDEETEKTADQAGENNENASNVSAMDTDDVIVDNKSILVNDLRSSAAATTDSAHAEQAANGEKESVLNKTAVHPDRGPSAIQKHVIENSKLISKLIDCWKYNADSESAGKGRRLGYMGHLIKIFKHIMDSISECEHIGALIECNLSDEDELKLWQTIINPTNGDLTKALVTQSKMLADCNAHEVSDYSQHLPKDFLDDNSAWEYVMSSDMSNLTFNNSVDHDLISATLDQLASMDIPIILERLKQDNAEYDINLFQYGRNLNDDDDNNDKDNDDNNSIGGGGGGDGSGIGSGSSLFGKNAVSTSALQAFGVTNNPWDHMDPFSDMTANSSNATPWAADFNSDNFADFDSHFSSFANDLGESLISSAAAATAAAETTTETDTETNTAIKEINTSNNAETEAEPEAESDANADADANEDDDGSGNKSGTDAKHEQQQQQQQPATDNGTLPNAIGDTTTSAAKSETAYDNNANVEKNITQEIGEFADGTSAADDMLLVDNNAANEKALAASLVRTLQSVMQDSEDDYEDDEGMWTKPLGGSVANDAHNDADECSDEAGSDDSLKTKLHFTNGPTTTTARTGSETVLESENEQQFNQTEDVESNSTTKTTHINEINNLDSESMKSAALFGIKRTNSSSTKLDAINDVGCNAATTTKAAAAAAAAAAITGSSNAVEVVPTTT